ncbi:MAG TPA: hypothetical protein VFK02_04730 [Kofleriaceae bacterium]|nr:hypothetical protein [Kofleriaceae bacterium]
MFATLWACPALADDDSDDAPDEDRGSDDAGGKFLLFGRDCKSHEEGLETTPDSPPLDGDDTGTPGCNRWEIDLSTTAELGNGQTWETPLLEVNYGVGDNVELTLELPYQLNRVEGQTTHGFGAAELGIKHRFYQDRSKERALAFYPQLELAIPGTALADAEDGFTVELPVLFSTRLAETGNGDIMLGVTAGYNVTTDEMSENYLSGAIGVGFPITRKLAVMVEGSTEQALTRNAADVREGYLKANLGVFGMITSKFMWFGSIGQTFAGSEGDDSSHTCFSLGLRILAGGS